jgi:hypothetical protein
MHLGKKIYLLVLLPLLLLPPLEDLLVVPLLLDPEFDDLGVETEGLLFLVGDE